MSLLTSFLNLMKPTPTDTTHTFNLDTYLNDNWDKLDTFAAKTMTTDNAVNNLSATEAGFYLDARQGKAIGDRLNTAEETLSNHVSDLITDTDGAHGLKIESGTWAPVLVGTTTAGTFTYNVQLGRYYKIGHLVYISAFIRGNTDSTIAGNVIITGLPFSSANNLPRGVCSITGGNIPLTNGYTQLTATQEYGTYQIWVKKVGNNLPPMAVVGSDIASKTGLELELNCLYTTN